jgi:hypothetical protein
VSYIPMHEFDRDPDLDRQKLIVGVAERALRINDRLLEQSGPGSDQRPGAGLDSPSSHTAIPETAAAVTPVRSVRARRSS